ncbi:Fpg/Nei family DNA glycosylase [Mycolicibacterium brumae]|uniref:Endonuclease 8 1 n=1 Tax=Mycolicibacterium brumae TaxID=85968 RepID=A0A2G5PBN2_9MYCO|nr:Fpg/Nei family DNA glycosylase [Mycolicibacterium brumae]MCV7191455.1 Fpg/Nei family DNA glycosylase [Mycolicibacterium brumae]PIB75735.1 Fpg/Nei family DNA glycosylase [Mycolicibacterium brumae]RWA16167.1 DNA glycosylase [Mycolicibacterium brumae DSM 44177]UWW09437.1 Fpg/Nei family DNA glycosylase [Mycolicibacterium brumae]
MPEGHVLHRLARLHQRRYGGKPVRVGSPQGRFADDAALIDGRVLRRADAWGKHLFHHYEPGLVAHVHLGIYGAFSEFALNGLDGPPDPIGQVRMRMLGPDYGADLRGPMVCEVIDEGGVADVLARLGPDPLRADADPAVAWNRVSRSRRSIASLLMDQSVFAGVGNIYRSEVLFRHGIDPMRPGVSISRAEFDAMWADLVAMMKVGERRGQIVVVRPEDDHGAPSYRAGRPRTYVYRRAGEACRICGSPVLFTELEGRNLFWCPACQH